MEVRLPLSANRAFQETRKREVSLDFSHIQQPDLAEFSAQISGTSALIPKADQYRPSSDVSLVPGTDVSLIGRSDGTRISRAVGEADAKRAAGKIQGNAPSKAERDN
jgi:hypothetical protein